MRPLTDAQLREGFFSRLRPEGDCLVWAGSRDNRGYGKIYIGGDRDMKAHRFAWKVAHGCIPAGMHILHRCDNPPCCKLEHLFLGTHADNMRDMARKGRQWLQDPARVPRGEARPHTLLTEAQVREAIASTASSGRLAQEWDVPEHVINRARDGRCWSHIDVPRISGAERRRRRSADRRAAVERLLNAGCSRDEIVATLGIPLGTVHADCVKIRDANGGKQPSNLDRVQDALAKAGRASIWQLVEATGLSYHATRSAIQRLGDRGLAICVGSEQVGSGNRRIWTVSW